MGVTVVSVNDITGILAVGLRALTNALGDDAAGVFLEYYRNTGPRPAGRPQTPPSEIADRMERSIEEAEAMSASVNGGSGDYTKERREMPEPSDEEFIEWILKQRPSGHPDNAGFEEYLEKTRAKTATKNINPQEKYAVEAMA
jgi:hypothetical protein